MMRGVAVQHADVLLCSQEGIEMVQQRLQATSGKDAVSAAASAGRDPVAEGGAGGDGPGAEDGS